MMDPMTTMMMAQAGASILSGIFGGKKRRREQREARIARDKMRAEYEALDTSNLYADMENPYEDLTVNLQQAEFVKNQQQQQQANILSGLQGAAGGSGIGGLAQSLSNMSVQSNARASAAIGAQESSMNQLKAQGQARVDSFEKQGATQARALQTEKISTLFGMESNRLAEANRARAQARQAVISGVSSLAMMGISGQFKGMGGNKYDLSKATTSGSPLDFTNQQYMSPIIGPQSIPYQPLEEFDMLNYNN